MYSLDVMLIAWIYHRLLFVMIQYGRPFAFFGESKPLTRLYTIPPSFAPHASYHLLSKISCLYNFIHPHYIWHDEFGQCRNHEYLSNFGVKSSFGRKQGRKLPFSVAVFGSVTHIIDGQKACTTCFTKRNNHSFEDIQHSNRLVE
jgi:hypothetical protein